MCSIGGLLQHQLPIYSDVDFLLSNFWITPTSCLTQSTQRTWIAKNKSNAAPQPQQRLYDPELTSLIPRRLPTSASSHIRTPQPLHSYSELGLTSFLLVYPIVGRDNCKNLSLVLTKLKPRLTCSSPPSRFRLRLHKSPTRQCALDLHSLHAAKRRGPKVLSS